MPFFPDDEGESFDPGPQVPNANEPMMMQDGSLVKTTPPVVTDANKTNPRFIPDPEPGYDPAKLTIAGNPIPPWMQSGASKITDIAIGANDTLASALGVQATMVDQMMQDIVGKGFLDKPWEGKRFIQESMQTIPGMSADSSKAFDQWWANMGEQAGTQALLTMAMLAGAGPMAATGTKMGSASLPGTIMRNVGETAVRNPGMVALGDAGSVIGGKTLPLANDILQGMGVNSNPEVLAILGNMLGAGVGVGVGSYARTRPQSIPGVGSSDKKGGIPRYAGRQINQAMPGVDSLLPRADQFNPDDISRAVDHYKKGVTSWMQNRMAKLTQGLADPAVAATRLRGAVETGYKKARSMETKLWAPIDMKRPVPTFQIQQAAMKVASSVEGPNAQAAFIPGDIINEITALKGTESIGRLRDLASVINKRAVTLGMQGNPALPSDRLRANLFELSNAIDNGIAMAYPADKQLAKAKEFSTWVHDTFSRGPVGAFGQVRVQAGAEADAATSLQTGMRDSRFGTQLNQMGETIGAPGAVQGRSEEFLRSTVAEAYRKGQPITPGLDPLDAEAAAATAAARHMNSPDFKRFAKAFPKLDAVLQRQFNQLQGALGRATEIRQSSFLDKAGIDPETAAASLVNSGNKVRDTRLIMQRIGGDEQAARGIAYSMIKQIGDGVKWDPTLFAGRLGSKDLDQALSNILGPDQMARMKRLVTSAMQYQGGQMNQTTPRKVVMRTGNIIGSLLTRAAGMNTIQATSIGSQAGGQLMERLFHVIPPEQMLANALVDPAWERFLLSKLPENIESFKATNRILGALVGTIETGHRKLMEDESDVE